MTDLRRTTLDELDEVGVELALSTAQAAALRSTLLLDVRPAGEGRFRLLPNGRVGAVRFDDVQIEVRPKHGLAASALVFLLGYAKDPGFRPEGVTADDFSDLWPAMAESLATAVGRALSLGLLQGYRTEQEALMTVRGRIAFEEHLRRRPGMIVPIEVRYDDFSVDIPENQLLLAAIHLMLGIPRLREETSRKLLHLAGRFEGVARLPRGFAPPRWRRNRLNERYHAALGLADVLLRHSSTRPAGEGTHMSAFVVVMWKVFEDFVTVALTEALADRPGMTQPQLPAYLTGDGDWQQGNPHRDVTMAVDLVHRDPAGRPRVVFDAKYKLASATGRYANADHYQMLAYCTALQVPVAWLLYAGAGRDVPRRIKGVGVEVISAPLDLRQPPDALLARVRDVALTAVARRPSPHQGGRE